MRPLLSLAALAFVASCSGADPAELARTTPFELARTAGHFVTVDQRRIFAITRWIGTHS